MTAIGRLFHADRAASTGASVLLVLPFLLLLGAVFVLPLGVLLRESLFDPDLTFRHYARIADDPVYLRVLLRTLAISAVVTLLCLLLGYPLAYVMARSRGLGLAFLAACVTVPLWTSVLVRTYAWTVLLRRNGLVNQGLMGLGLTDAPLRLLYTEGAVVVAMTHVLLPFTVLPIWASLRALPPDYGRAAAILGAGPARAFVHVIWPLSRPGVASGTLMTFLLALGFYVTPALVGGPRSATIATLIGQQVRETLNWPFAGALVGVLLLVTVLLVALFHRAAALDRFVEGR